MTARALFLHEIVDVVGTGTWPYMEHTVAAQGDEKVNFRLIGTFATMGVTGRWPQVVNLWEVPGGWEGWATSIDRLNLRRRENQALDRWWRTAYEHRSGGVDRLLVGGRGTRGLDDLVAAGVRGDLFVHELTEVRPGAGPEYVAAIEGELAPLLAERGHTLVGAYEVGLTDVEVCSVWATDVASHVALARDRSEGDARLAGWDARRRGLVTRWREELMTPCPGIPIGPAATDGTS